MKKTLVMVVAGLVCVSAMADIAVEWKSTESTLADITGAAYFNPVGSYAALIWSEVAPSVQAVLTSQGISSDGTEILLNSTVTTALGGGFAVAGTTYADVLDTISGNVDINTGYFFTRIFDGGVEGSTFNYYQGGLTDSAQLGTLNEAFDGLGLPLPAYNTAVLGVGDFESTSNTYTVIPEPATFGLMGIAGLGMFLARKKTRS